MKINIYIINKHEDAIDQLIISSNRNYYSLKSINADVLVAENEKKNPQNLQIFANGLQIWRFLNEITIANQYRRRITANETIRDNVTMINWVPEKRQFIDYKWNYRILYLVLKRVELDYIMSWMSTLGGAFSSLGEDDVEFANIAGKISVKQFNIAMSLGDPLTISRCKLYYVIALIQRGELRNAKEMLKREYEYALTQAEHDKRLLRMCCGIWTKLRYEYQERAKRRHLQNRSL